jgi:hypothetical protein
MVEQADRCGASVWSQWLCVLRNQSILMQGRRDLVERFDTVPFDVRVPEESVTGAVVQVQRLLHGVNDRFQRSAVKFLGMFHSAPWG